MAGLISMRPSSISHSGTGATINANGGVDIDAVSSVSLNGVFTSAYENYLVLWNGTASGTVGLSCRYRVAGADATGANYDGQYYKADSTSMSGARSTGQTSISISDLGAGPNGMAIHIYGVATAAATAQRCESNSPVSNALIVDWAGIHTLTTAYDGLTVFPSSGSISGTIHVFAYEE